MTLEQLANRLQIVGGFELSLAEFTGSSFSVTGEATAAQGVAFSDDGASMFVLGEQAESVFQYSLTTGFDVSTASFSGTSFDVSAEENQPEGIAFNPDGTRMFVIGSSSNSVHQYSLSTGFDLSTASFTGTSFDVSGQSTTPRGVAFNPDGTRMFVIGTSADSVFQYSLSTAFDVSTASFTGISFDVSGQDINSRGVAFNPDGSGMFIIGADNDSVFEYLVGRLKLQS